ncbi:unnamed protein product [Dicrocoelium dendriticum]|nr:unnamed protein product [Dicrocoelium dendriticum]
MSGSRKGLVAPQNTFLDKIIRRCNGQFCSFVLANARIVDYPIVYCNEGFARLVGYSRVDIMQKSGNCVYFYGEQTTQEMRDRLLKALDTQTADQIEMIFYKKNHSVIWVLVYVAPVKNEQEEAVLFLLAFRDITPLKTPLEDDDTTKGLSKFARLARSVTRSRSALQSIPSPQNTQSPSTPTLASAGLLGIPEAGSIPPRLEGSSDPRAGFPGSHILHAGGNTSRLYDSTRSDAERGTLNTSAWLELVPPYKQEAPKTPPHIILHYVAFKTTWDWIILFLTGYTAVMVPFNAAFKSKTMDDVSFLVVDSIVDVIFFIDIVLNFHTTFVGPNGEVISDAAIIRINYLKGWFMVDLLSCLPYDVFNAFQPEATQSTISSLFGTLKVVRLLRIGRVTRKLDQYLEYMAASLLLMISGFVLLAHWLACVWYSLGQADLKNGIYYGWIPRLLSDIDQTKAIPANWTSGPLPLPRTMTYVTSLYFTLSLITSIGFGNVSATTFGEKIVSVVFMLIGAFGYATIFGNVTTIFQGMYATRSRYHDMMGSVKDFIKTHSVPKDLAERVIDYVTSTWAITKGIDTAKVLNYCPKDMKADLCIHLNRMVFNEHPAFRLASDGCLRALAVNFNTIHTAPGDLIFHQGESIDQLCFVVSGSLEVIQDDEIVAFLGRGDVFGEPFWKDPNRMSHSAATVRALTYCDLHCIKKDSLLQVLSFYSAFSNSFARNLVLTYDLKTRLIFRKLADVKREYELAEHRNNDNPLSGLRADHPVRRMIHRFRMIGAHAQTINGSSSGGATDPDPKGNRLPTSLSAADNGDATEMHKTNSRRGSLTNSAPSGEFGANHATKLDGITSKWSKRISLQRSPLSGTEDEDTNLGITHRAVESERANAPIRSKLQSRWGRLLTPAPIKEESEKDETTSHKSSNQSIEWKKLPSDTGKGMGYGTSSGEGKKEIEAVSNQQILTCMLQMQSELTTELNTLMKRMDQVDSRIGELLSTVRSDPGVTLGQVNGAYSESQAKLGECENRRVSTHHKSPRVGHNNRVYPAKQSYIISTAVPSNRKKTPSPLVKLQTRVFGGIRQKKFVPMPYRVSPEEESWHSNMRSYLGGDSITRYHCQHPTETDTSSFAAESQSSTSTPLQGFDARSVSQISNDLSSDVDVADPCFNPQQISAVIDSNQRMTRERSSDSLFHDPLLLEDASHPDYVTRSRFINATNTKSMASTPLNNPSFEIPRVHCDSLGTPNQSIKPSVVFPLDTCSGVATVHLLTQQSVCSSLTSAQMDVHPVQLSSVTPLSIVGSVVRFPQWWPNLQHRLDHSEDQCSLTKYTFAHSKPQVASQPSSSTTSSTKPFQYTDPKC